MANLRKEKMIKHLLAGVAALGLMTGVALAQGAPGSGSSTTTVTSSPNGGSSTSTTRQGTGWNGNQVTKKDTPTKAVPAARKPTQKPRLIRPAAALPPTQPSLRTRNKAAFPALHREILA